MPGDGGFVSAEAPHDGVNTVTTRCRLLCHDLDCGAKFFGDDLASCRNSSIFCETYLWNDRRTIIVIVIINI